jgi:carbonic anhydrase/acetyltransferase-like protein (isoleucine patch superfamily)
VTVYALKGLEPTLDRAGFIAPNATVIGDVRVGDQSSVWFGTVVRGDVYPIRIGARTNIQDNSVVHVTGGKEKTTIGDDVTIGHLALIHGCTIGHRCLIGMGSVVLDGAVIEDDCLIAAGSLIPPRTRIPSGSFVVGRPARVLRTLTEDDRELIRDASARYVALAHELRGSLAQI